MERARCQRLFDRLGMGTTCVGLDKKGAVWRDILILVSTAPFSAEITMYPVDGRAEHEL